MAIIIPANSAADTAYSVANSCRFNDGDSPKMVKQLGTPSSQQTFTLSTWFKLGNVKTGANRVLFCFDQDSNDLLTLYLHSTKDQLALYSEVSGSAPFYQLSNALIRDPSAWYHVAAIIDGTNGTQADRLKIYLNGTRITSWATDTQWSSVANIAALASGNDIIVGAGQVGSSSITLHWEGYLAETVYLDGTAAAIGDLGEFDSDSPTIWKPKDVSGLTFGNNGFYCDYEASGNLGNDANGGTDLTETNLAAIDQCSDSPTNNFCTLNPLDNYYDPATFSEGNLSITTETDGRSFKTGTFGVSKGKWYWEIFRRQANGHTELGIAGMPSDAADDHLGKDAFTYAVHSDDGNWFTNDSGSSFVSAHNSGGTYPNHVVSIALDLDNNKFYFGINGTWENSGDPTSGATGTGAKAIAAASTTPTGLWFPAVSDKHNAYNIQLDMNFGGTSAFGATAVASANQDADGYGNFEFAVPSGYYALCTKNLAEYG